jgi:hypothetical protein
MTDAKQQKAMQILEQIHVVTFYAQVDVHPFIVIKMVDISVAHGTLVVVRLFVAISLANSLILRL